MTMCGICGYDALVWYGVSLNPLLTQLTQVPHASRTQWPYGTCAYDLSDDDLPEPQNIFCKRDFVEREYMHIDPCTVY
jgi:hypothetical protein